MTSPLKLGKGPTNPPNDPPPAEQPPRHPPRTDPPKDNRPPTKPRRQDGNAEVLADIDDALIGLLAMAHFGPAEQGTSQSVDVACASEVLMFRLRSARKAVAELREALELPARQVPLTHARVYDDTASVPGGLGPNVPGGADSEGSRPGRNGRAVGADGAATFANPNSRVPLKFGAGENRLYGPVTSQIEALPNR